MPPTNYDQLLVSSSAQDVNPIICIQDVVLVGTNSVLRHLCRSPETPNFAASDRDFLLFVILV